jgi:hypothetical protein
LAFDESKQNSASRMKQAEKENNAAFDLAKLKKWPNLIVGGNFDLPRPRHVDDGGGRKTKLSVFLICDVVANWRHS